MPHLILTRKVGQSIRIGDDVVVYVKAIEGSHVHLMTLAPRDVRITRGELAPLPNPREKAKP